MRHWRPIAFWMALALLLLWRPVFVLGVPFSVFAGAPFDDGLFLRLALELRAGNWLGEYHYLTLSKGPFYPMFVAAVSVLGAPLAVFEQGFYGVIALVAVWSVRPAVRSRWLLLAGLALLVLNPVSWGPVPARFTRDPLAGQMALLCMAGVIGMLLRRNERLVDVAIWGALAGVAGAACWLTREEGVWIVAPAVFLVLVAAGMVAWERRGEMRRAGGRVALIIATPAVFGVLPVMSVALENWQQYGVFAVVELKTRAFEDAYGALLRVGTAHHRQYVPVPIAAREAAYEVSPAFARLRPHLEGEAGERWLYHRAMPDPQDIQGGWFIWALRDAVEDATEADAARQAALYRAIADEVNAACDAGLIACGARRSGLVTPYHPDDAAALRNSLGRYFAGLVVWPSIRPQIYSFDDSSAKARAAHDLVHMQLTGPRNSPTLSGWACAAEGQLTLAFLERSGRESKFKPQWLASPDVAEYLRANGKDWSTVEWCRFVHPGSVTATHLLLYRAEREVGRIPLKGNGERMLVGVEVMAAIDSFVTRPEPVLPRSKRLLFGATERLIHWLAPVLVAVAGIWFALGIWHWRRHALWLCVTGSLAGAVVVRTGLLAYIDATTYAIRGHRYVEPTYTVFMFLLVLFMFGVVGHFTHRRAAAEKEKPGI